MNCKCNDENFILILKNDLARSYHELEKQIEMVEFLTKKVELLEEKLKDVNIL